MFLFKCDGTYTQCAQIRTKFLGYLRYFSNNFYVFVKLDFGRTMYLSITHISTSRFVVNIKPSLSVKWENAWTCNMQTVAVILMNAK